MFGAYGLTSSTAGIYAIPVFVFEASFAIYRIVKGSGRPESSPENQQHRRSGRIGARALDGMRPSVARVG